MGLRVLATFLLLLLTSCPKSTPEPGVLGIQFTGMWKGAPNIRATGTPSPHPFLARLTGYVPPEAAIVRVYNPWGEQMAESPVLWRDVMEVIPQRTYTFSWPVSIATYWAVKDRLDARPLSSENELLSTKIEFPIRAVVLTQDGKTLIGMKIYVTIECLGCSV